jgi:transcriptional antiterminator NusG
VSENQNLDLFDEVVDETQSAVTPAAQESFADPFSAPAEAVEEAVTEEAVTEEAVTEEAVTEEVATEVAVSAEAVSEEDSAAESSETESSEEPEEVDPIQEFKDALMIKSGDWFVIHSYAGYEKRVKENLESRIKSLDMDAFIFEVAVPYEEVTEIKNQKPRKVLRNKLPGYILVRANLDSEETHGDKAWGTIRHTPGVTGFIGSNNHPIPLSIDEVANILAPKPEKKSSSSQPGSLAPKIEVLDFAVGDSVTIIDGPFTSVQTTISEINIDAQKVIGLVEIFGRETQVELAFNQVQRND